MTKLLHLKHWQIFLLLFGIPFLFEIIASVFAIVNPERSLVFVVFPILMVLFVGLYFSWLYVLGVQLHKKLPASVSMNLTRFRLFLIIPIVYLFAFMIYMSVTMSDPENMEEPGTGIIGVIIPLHLFSVFCIIYSLYFIAKELKSVEWGRPVTFNDFAGEFFLIWFYPIGIWFIQPRINKLFDEGLQADNTLFHQPL